ncbi:hypothetical protein AGDE_14688 [Angomonas deanei]|uniref:Uncharacterized protein n=1 Tax=Angomonas deanei TaxID=59799 RepID=A0A7G2CHS4_9TRYP|nr:hypothetical protein AGDE_14688 [Angomonas deanei]CAD2217762.1 hypothetical protein, conserved [Angomonas deanei]|eukprot:EPY20418.1 hypothetical protein AGDE_14688 [Angomonas deanei]
MLEGLPSSDAAVLNSRLLYEEVCEQFELYEILIEDGLLFAPHSFLFNQYIPFPMDDRKAVIELYYAVDDCACYHYFGNKMSRYDHMEFSASNEKTGFFSRLLAPPAGRVSVTEKQTPTHIVEQLVKLREGSVRRQWENLKRVCTTISMMYQGKGGLFAPRDIPLIQLVQQCFGLSNKSLLSYASMAFGFEHRLETDMFCHLRSFEEIASVCTLIAGMWCDESQLLLKKRFCRRV